MNALLELLEHGQSYWLDNLTRDIVRDGELARRVEQQGLRGVTSNPAIFHKAITGGRLYDDQIRDLALAGASVSGIYEALVVTDVGEACDVLRPVWQSSDGVDGYVSLEVSPRLVHDTRGSVEEARRLWDAVDRPNLMIKIPGTPAGLPAIEQLLFDGINVNVTLLFSVGAYEAVHDAYVRALARRREAGRPLGTVASVASFFLSRIDTLVDALLSQRVGDGHHDDGGLPASGLFGQAAVASAKIAYRSFEQRIGREDWRDLVAHGARPQRLLWASTSTKNPLYDPVRYVEPLIGPDTVNTMPEVTIEAFAEEGEIRAGSIREDVDGAERVFRRLGELGIDLAAVCEQLVNEGADKFLQPFDRLMAGLAARRRDVLEDRVARFVLGSDAARSATPRALVDAVSEQRFGARLAAKDPSLWTDDPSTIAAIRNRLGWVDAPGRAGDELYEIRRFAAEIRDEGFQHVVVLGMGGSSLCPLVTAETFGRRDGWPELLVLDDVDPRSVRAVADRVDPLRTLFLVSSKSGTTIETLSLYRYFLGVVEAAGARRPGSSFVALTDPGSPLLEEAQRRGFRRAWETPSDVGGRFSALTAFGLLPMALAGVDVDAVVTSALDLAADCGTEIPDADNPAVVLGVALAQLAQTGRDKLTLFASPSLSALPLWIEQLVAESTGKDGKGIVPVTHEPPGTPDTYGHDRVFVSLTLDGEEDPAIERLLDALGEAGHPVFRVGLPRREAVGGEYYRWEAGVAVAGALLGVNPFDEPDVAASKRITGEILAATAGDETPDEPPRVAEGGVEAHLDGGRGWARDLDAHDVSSLLRSFLAPGLSGGYVGILGYLPPASGRDARVGRLRERIRARTGAATTFGAGPRYLHSSGQLHKGGPDTGRFLLLTADAPEELPVPGSAYGFARLQRAEALGDERALLDAGRPVLRVNLGWYADDGLEALSDALT